MYAGITCFWLEATGRQGISLRRYQRNETPCPAAPGRGYHDASSDVIAYEPLIWRESDHGLVRESPRDRSQRLRSWPSACECGYAFRPDDHWQTNGNPEWRKADGMLVVGEMYGLPPGALVHMEWNPWGKWRDRYGDGINLHAICPNGTAWHVDGAAISNGAVTAPEAWTRTGDPRKPETLTVSPSIVAGDYHGFLTGGRFTDG